MLAFIKSQFASQRWRCGWAFLPNNHGRCIIVSVLSLFLGFSFHDSFAVSAAMIHLPRYAFVGPEPKHHANFHWQSIRRCLEDNECRLTFHWFYLIHWDIFCVGHIWTLFQFARPRIYAQGEESNHFYILEDTALTLPEKYFLSLIDMIVAPVCFVVMYIYVYI